MKKGYTVHNNIIGTTFNFILVSNYAIFNEVVNYSWNNEPIKLDESDIGMWKIKKLKHEL